MMEETANLERAERIGFVSTKLTGRPRWTELEVFYLHEPTSTGKRYLCRANGMSSLKGEKKIVREMLTFGLEQGLTLFDDSQIGISVKAQARDWLEHFEDTSSEGQPVLAKGKAPEADAFAGTTDAEALEWLFGDDVPRSHMARLLGLNESTLRQQLGGKGVRVSLVSIAPFLNRQAFREARLGGANAA